MQSVPDDIPVTTVDKLHSQNYHSQTTAPQEQVEHPLHAEQRQLLSWHILLLWPRDEKKVYRDKYANNEDGCDRSNIQWELSNAMRTVA